MTRRRYPRPGDPALAEWFDELDDDAAEYFTERAGFREYCAGFTRDEAEALAKVDILLWLDQRGEPE